MSLNFREQLVEEKRFSGIPIFLLCFAIIFILTFSNLFPEPQYYEGSIRLEPESTRSKPYISFHLSEDKAERKYMVLIQDLTFQAKIEAMLDKHVRVKALLYKHEPIDFDKIEIIEIKEIR